VTSTAGIGLVLALASAIALNWGFFTQHGATSTLPRLSVRHPLASLRLLYESRRWLLGFAVGILGWALYIAALRFAPLSLVQAVSAGGLGLLFLFVWRSGGAARPSRRELFAVVVSMTGLVLLAVSLAGSTSQGTAPPAITVAAWLIVLSVTAGALVGSIGIGLPAAAALGSAAGVLYATGDIATKAVVVSAGVLFVPAVLVAHGLAFVSLQLGFQRGGALMTAGLATLLTNALPIAAGAALFGEHMPAGMLGDLRLAAFALVTAGAALLAQPSRSPDGQSAGRGGAASESARPTHARA
jgi:hypothetical protein